jgi:hypothetical protein
MCKEDDHYHYSICEIKEIFQENLDRGNWPITPTEFENFCMILSCLDKERVDLLKEEIHIIIWSQQIEKKENDKIFFHAI